MLNFLLSQAKQKTDPWAYSYFKWNASHLYTLGHQIVEKDRGGGRSGWILGRECRCRGSKNVTTHLLKTPRR